MVKMKNMLFPLLMIMGIGSAPTMQALSGAERAKIKLQLDKAFTANKFSQVKQLIETLRRGGEERIADESALKLNSELNTLLNNFALNANDIWKMYTTVQALGHGVGGQARINLQDHLFRLDAQMSRLFGYLRQPNARNSLILDLWAPVFETVKQVRDLFAYLILAVTKGVLVDVELNAIVDQQDAIAASRNALDIALDHNDNGLKGAIEAADLAARRTKAAATLASIAVTNQVINTARLAVDTEIGGDGIAQP